MRGRILLAGAVWAGTAPLAGAAMIFVASDERERQLAATAPAVSGELFTATEPRPFPNSTSLTAPANHGHSPTSVAR